MNSKLDIAVLVGSEVLKESIRSGYQKTHNLYFLDNYLELIEQTKKSPVDIILLNCAFLHGAANNDSQLFEHTVFLTISEEKGPVQRPGGIKIGINFPNENYVHPIMDGLRLLMDNLSLRKLHEDAKRFAPRIVHEIRNPCSIVKYSIENLKTELKNGAPIEVLTHLEKAQYGMEKLEEIMSTMMVLDSSVEKGSNAKLTVIDIGEIVKQASEDLADQFHDCPAIEIQSSQLDTSLMIQFEPMQLQQILFNLLKNAYQAQQRQAVTEIRVTMELVHGQFLSLSVIDSGPGIPESIRGKIFRSNFTTKEQKESQGIGLALCRKIAHKNKAELMLDQDSKETKFDLLIPFVAA